MPKNGFKSLEVGFYFRSVISHFVQNNRLKPGFASYFKGKQLQWAIHYLGTPTDNRRHYHYAIYITQSAGLVEKNHEHENHGQKNIRKHYAFKSCSGLFLIALHC